MRLHSLHLRSFRAHADTSLNLAPGINLLVGPNGAGKTNILEAIGFLSLGKSFLASSDQHVMQRGGSFFDVEGATEGEHRAPARLRVAVVPGEGKKAFANGAPLDRLADLVGRLPVVVMAPSDHELTAGGPIERRRFLDTTLSQAKPVYLDDLIKYRRALQQKNALLMQVRRGGSLMPGTMDAWDEELAQLGARIVERRNTFLLRFSDFVSEAFGLLDAPGDTPTLTYAPSVKCSEDEEVADSFRAALSRTARRSRDLGRTLVGPHLDEVEFRLGGFELRPYASQGQHRTFGLALRVAQALYLRDRLEESPILLLDDVFGPLDPDRSRVVLELLAARTLGQSFITAARDEPFVGQIEFGDGNHDLFHVEQGAVQPASLPTLTS